MSAIDQKIAEATAKALNELLVKDLCTINSETAVVWCGRALAAYQMYAETAELQCLLDAAEYEHEALEHAALARPALYQVVLGYLQAAKIKCGR